MCTGGLPDLEIIQELAVIYLFLKEKWSLVLRKLHMKEKGKIK